MKAYDATTISALSAADVRLVLFLKLALDDNVNVRYCTAGHDIVASVDGGSQTWLGMGSILSVDPLRETGAVESVGVKITLSGVPTDLVSLALQEPVIGRTASIWIGVYTEAGALVMAPVLEFQGRIDTLEVEDEAESAKVVLSIESRLAALMAPEGSLLTDAEQQRRFSGDTGLRFVNTAVERTMRFGPNG